MTKHILLLRIVIWGLLLTTCAQEQPTIIIPDYPRAQQLHTFKGERANAPNQQRTTFVTSDTPEQVLAWYRVVLPPHGWNDRSLTFDPSTIRFYYSPDCRSFQLDIEATSQQPDVTFVQMYFTPYTC